METRVFAEIERYQPDKHVHVPVFNGDGRMYFVDGAQSFNPGNPHAEPFQMLIHLIKK